MSATYLLAAYDQQVRRSFPRRVPSSWTAERDECLTRCLTGSGGFVLTAPEVRDVSDAALDALIGRTVDFFGARGLAFEWKTFGHDGARITDLLLEHGFLPETPEALVLGDTRDLTGPEPVVEGVRVRAGTIEDLPAVAAMEEQIWSRSWDWFVPEMTARLSDPEPTYLVLAETADRVVSAGWLVPMVGTTCAGLWGGSTLLEFRGIGIYRALVRARANAAAARGYDLLHVDATDDSRPILQRLGLHVVGATTPYRWAPTT